MTAKKMLTAACAIALGFAWTIAPASAADDTAKDKMERAKDKTETKAEDVKDKTKDTMGTAKDKMGNAVDKTKEKAVEIKDKTKEKAVEVKDKIKNKISGRSGTDDVRQAQEALVAKGFNPGPVDGKMGPHTKAAISDFQKKENIKVTGSLDSETKSRLGSSSKADTSTPAASPATSTTGTASGTATPTGPATDSNANTKKQVK
jgi:peptidoglycan hydrolase-like protein with peptidoglycan-binding domain